MLRDAHPWIRLARVLVKCVVTIPPVAVLHARQQPLTLALSLIPVQTALVKSMAPLSQQKTP